jgi:hypothetical protein
MFEDPLTTRFDIIVCDLNSFNPESSSVAEVWPDAAGVCASRGASPAFAEGRAGTTRGTATGTEGTCGAISLLSFAAEGAGVLAIVIDAEFFEEDAATI